MKNLLTFFIAFLLLSNVAAAQDMTSSIDNSTAKIMPQVVQWRRHLHQYPELSNREFKTAKYVEEHLKNLGLEVKTGVAKTGVVAILKGAQPGPVIGLRADMDALPVTERVSIPFASKEKVGIQRRTGRRDARLRSRYARRNADGCGDDSCRNER